MKDGFLKIACVTPPLRVADCAYNAEQIIAHAREAAAAGAKLAAFPELCLTGYTCGDLFLQEPLLRGAEDGLMQILQETADLSMLLVIGLPYVCGGALYNCAAVCYAGKTEQGEDLVYVALNVYWEKQRFELPKLPNAYEWKRFIDTALDEADEVTITEYWLQPRSVAVFIGTRTEI